MNPKLKIAIFLLSVAAVAGLACLATGHWLRTREQETDLHAWVHDQLGLTPDQEQAIEQTEARFQTRRRELLLKINAANAELAQAILEAHGPSAKVSAAVEKIHQAQAELQRITIEHVFEMKPALRAEQYDKLLQLTARALSDQPH